MRYALVLILSIGLLPLACEPGDGEAPTFDVAEGRSDGSPEVGEDPGSEPPPADTTADIPPETADAVLDVGTDSLQDVGADTVQDLWTDSLQDVGTDTLQDQWADMLQDVGADALSEDICQPSCEGMECGGDGCGGSCGACTGYLVCQGGQCVSMSTWTDPETGLIWQNPHSGFQWSWLDAKWYCISLVLGGYSDWRLPEIWELRTLTDGCPGTMSCALCEVCEGCTSSSCASPDCDGCADAAGPDAGCYWKGPIWGDCMSSWSITQESADVHWYLSFDTGGVHHGPDADVRGIRCVH